MTHGVGVQVGMEGSDQVGSSVASSSSSSSAAAASTSGGSSHAYPPYQPGSGRYRSNGVGGGASRERSKHAGVNGRYRDRDRQAGDDHHHHHHPQPHHFISGSPLPAASASSSSSSSSSSRTSRSTLSSSRSTSMLDIDLQTPKAFITIIGLLLFTVASYKTYQHFKKEWTRRKREEESEKAAEELLRLNVKHGVMDRDGTVLGTGGKVAGGVVSATGVNVAMTGGSLMNRKEGKDRTSKNDKSNRSTMDEDRRKRNDPVHSTTSISPTTIATITTPVDDPDSASRTNKNEAKKAKKKIKRAAKLEQRKDTEDNVLGFEPSEEGGSRVEPDPIEENEIELPVEMNDKESVREDEVEVELREVEVDQPAELGVVEESGPVEEVVAPIAVTDDKEITAAPSSPFVNLVSEPIESPFEPVEPPLEPVEIPLEPVEPPSEPPTPPFIQNMPSIEVQNIALPNSPPYSKIDCPESLRRPSESLSDSAASLLSGAGGSSSGLSNHLPAISQQLAHHHQDASGTSTPSDKPAPKQKKKAKTGGAKPQRAIPGAENWVRETHEERQREHHEQLIREAEQAKMAASMAEARAIKMEEKNEVSMNRIHKLEQKLSKMTLAIKDLTEREKQAMAEKEEAYKRSTEAQKVMQNYRKVEMALKHEANIARQERDKMWQDAQRNEADLRTQLQQMNAQLAQAVHSAASYESALRAAGRMSGNPAYGSPLPIMSTPVGLPSHHGHMLLGNPLPNQSRMSLSNPPSPQSIMTPNGSPWAERNMMSATPGSPSKKRSPGDAYGLPLVHPLSANSTPARESSLARTVLKHKGDNLAVSTTQPPATPTTATQTTPGRNRAGTVNDALSDSKEKENQPPVADGVGSSMSESVSLPNSLKLREADDITNDAQETIDSPTIITGDDTDHFFVFPSLHHNPEHVAKAMEEERGRRASLQRATSGMSQLGSPSASPGKTHANKISLKPESDEVGIYDESSGTDMTDSHHGSTASSSQNGQDGSDGHDVATAKQPDLSPVNESTEVLLPVL